MHILDNIFPFFCSVRYNQSNGIIVLEFFSIGKLGKIISINLKFRLFSIETIQHIWWIRNRNLPFSSVLWTMNIPAGNNRFSIQSHFDKYCKLPTDLIAFNWIIFSLYPNRTIKVRPLRYILVHCKCLEDIEYCVRNFVLTKFMFKSTCWQ